MNILFKNRQEQVNEFQKLRKIIMKKEKSEDVIVKKCPHCNEDVAYSELSYHFYVCPKCGYHFKISAKERIKEIIDTGTFREVNRLMTTKNNDHFVGYDEKLAKYKKETGLNEAVICGTGKIDGYKCAIAVMDSHFMMGSMGAVVGEKITKLIELATRKKLPLIICSTSGGARMQEGIVSLMQMAKTTAALQRFNGLYISVLTHPTTGGVSASFAMLGDIILAEPDALIGFAGKRVIEKTINEQLPDCFQKSEFLLEKGFVDAIVERKDMKRTLSDLIRLHGGVK